MARNIPMCTQTQAKKNGQFICTRPTIDSLEAMYRKLKDQLIRGSLKYYWEPKDGYCLYYFEKTEMEDK